MDLQPLPIHEPDRAPPGRGRAGTPGLLERWSAPLALVWSLVTVVWAVSWVTSLLPHPFGDPDAIRIGAVFNTAPPMVGIAFTLVLGSVGAGVAAALLRARGRRRQHGPALEALGWILTLTPVATLLHGKVLPLLGYTPVVLTIGWFHPPLLPAYLAALKDPEIHLQLHVLAGVALWALATVIHRRARRGACTACGRRPDWTGSRETSTRVAALRRGRAAVMIGAVAALTYPAIRLPWLAGMPIGMDADTFSDLQATPGAVATGITLGLAAVAGIVLMLGLVQDWGVRFPRWLPGLSGRRVPVGLAVVPAMIVSLALVAMGRGFLTALATGQLASFAATDWAHVLAFAAMLPWGLALGAATLAYAHRRRGICNVCSQGAPELRPSVLAAIGSTVPACRPVPDRHARARRQSGHPLPSTVCSPAPDHHDD
jgi:hypothetical protein